MRHKDYNVYVVQKKDGTVHLHTFSSKDFVQPTINALSYQMLLKSSNREPIEMTCIVMGDAELKKMLRKTKGRIVRGKALRQSNPRNSKVKDALAAEATRHDKFEVFAKAYWDACARGLYWVATDEKRFYIGEHERELIAAGRFEVFCSPALALAGKNDKKKYVAEMDVTRLPGSSLQVIRGAQGSRIRITGSAGSVKVTRVLEAAKARRAWKWQLSILPSSKEELRKVWTTAWTKRRRQDEIRRVRKRKEDEREQKRAATKREKEAAANERMRKEREKLIRRKKARRTQEGRAARRRAEAEKTPATAKKTSKKTGTKKASKKATKKTSKKKGRWKRVPMPNPGERILCYINNPECER